MSDLAMVGKPKKPAAVAPQPTQAPAPTERPKTPMEQIAELMEPNSYQILLGLVNWSNLFQELHNAGATGEGGAKMTDDVFRVMVSPFTGFGGNPMVYQQLSHALVPQIMSCIIQWRADESYREANTMPWLIIQAAAPTLANIDKGWEAASGVYKILGMMKDKDG